MNPVKVKVCILSFLSVFLLYTVPAAQVNSESDDFSYALKLFDEGFYELAAKQFSRFVNRYASSSRVAEAAYYTGLSLYNLKDYANASVEFQGVAFNYPTSPRAAESWFMMGECYTRMNKSEEAAKAYEIVKNLHPAHPVAAKSILRAGEVYQQLNELDKAEQLYILIQNRYVDSPEYFAAIADHGSLYIQKGERGKADEKLQKVVASSSDEPLKARALFLLGEMNRSGGYLNTAAGYFQKITSGYTKTAAYQPAALALAQIYLLQNRSGDALKILNPALNANPPTEQKYRLQEKLGDAYYLTRQYALALKAYEQSDENKKDPAYVLRRLKGALCWQGQNNITRGIEQIQEIIRDTSFCTYSGFTETKQLYFDWLNQLHNLDQGIADLNYLKAAGRFDRKDRLKLIEFYKSRNDGWSVIREIEPELYAEEKFAEKDDLLFEYAVACEKTARYAESAKAYRQIIDTYAASEWVDQAQQNLAYLEKYKLTGQDIGSSYLHLLGNIINREDADKLQLQLGKIYFEILKDYDSALSQLQKALTTADNQAVRTDIVHWIGLTYWRLAERRDIPSATRDSLLKLAKENFSNAMAQIGTHDHPDELAWDFVQLGITVEKSPLHKQIGYIETLVEKYPQSSLREDWLSLLAGLHAQTDSTLTRALDYYNLLCRQFTASKHYPEYLYERAAVGRKSGGDTAPQDYRRIAGSYPNASTAALALYQLGMIYMDTDGYKEAGQLFMKLKNDYYYSKEAEMVVIPIADTYLYSGQYESALKLYQSQLTTLPEDDVVLNREFVSTDQKSTLYKLGRALSALQRMAEAQNYLTRYLAWDPQGPYADAAYFLLGEIYLGLNDPQNAVTSFSKVTSADKQHYQQALLKTAEAYMTLGEYDQAAQNYAAVQKLIAGEPEEIDIATKNIIALIRGGKKQQAESEINLLIKKFKPESNRLAEFQFEFGEYYRQNKNFDAAVKYFKIIKDKYSKSAYVDDAEYALALTYLVLNRHEEALAILTKFAVAYPESDKLGAVLNTMGTIYFRSEKYESAMSSFKSALEKPLPADLKPQVMSNLIKAYTFVNFWDAALALAREYLQSYPQAGDLVDKKILMGRAYIQLGQVEQAVELLKETKQIADSEQEPEIQFYIGEAYFQAGQYETAITEFVKIPFLSRKTKLQWEASALYYSGQSYEKLGRNDEAVRMYEEIIKRPGIDIVLKKEAQKRITQLK
jgi:tetratricopeptide (TPR) repeat protein